MTGFHALLTGRPAADEWISGRSKGGALIRVRATMDTWIMQIPQAFQEAVVRRTHLKTIGER
jgi:hypothetical protein